MLKHSGFSESCRLKGIGKHFRNYPFTKPQYQNSIYDNSRRPPHYISALQYKRSYFSPVVVLLDFDLVAQMKMSTPD